jgi:hypothetical protein
MAQNRPKAAVDLPSVLAALNDEALLDFVDAVDGCRALASASKQLSSLFRSRLWLDIEIENPEDIALLLVALAGCRPFLRCERLTVSAADSAVWSMIGGLLSAADQWPELKRLQLIAGHMELPPGVSVDHVTTGVLGVLPVLQALRHLTLEVPAMGACSAACMGRVTQLTNLRLSLAEEPAADAAALDLAALSRLVQLQVLEMGYAPPVQPAAGQEGPFSLPSSLVSLMVNAKDDYDAGDEREAVIGPWVTHLRGCPHLQQLQLWYGAQEYASTDHSAVLQLLAQHTKQLRVLEMGVPRDSDPPAHVYEDWRPTAALAALTGLQHLSAEGLCISNQADWQHMAQLTGLTQLEWVKLCVHQHRRRASPCRGWRACTAAQPP